MWFSGFCQRAVFYVQDQTFSDDWEPRFDIQQEVTPAEVAKALAKTSPWKAPGEDLLPTGLLKA